jgi:hypothetical protein
MKQKAALSEHIDEESVKNRIRILLEEIQTDTDPHLLNRYRTIFRKEVSFFQRSYMAAYLLLLAENGKPAAIQGKSRFPNRSKEARPPKGDAQDSQDLSYRTGRGAKREVSPPDEARFIPEEESVRLFISIGRNRKVFPREILGLINSKTEVSKNDIGLIRILDNYSFVQVRTTVADEIIGALNNQNFRGRTLTVNYARPRDVSEDSIQENNG